VCCDQVLRPWSHTSSLDIWSFYCSESLGHGTSFDIELTESELRDDDDHDNVMTDVAPADSAKIRRLVNGCYDNVELMQPAIFSFVLSVSCRCSACVPKVD